MTDRGMGVLVLCTGNSARSQIAEALFRHHGGGRVRALSAGTEPAAEVHPLALRVLEERGLPVEGARPKAYSELLGRVPVHTVVIVCDGAARSCPSAWPGAVERLLWPFEDPAAVEGSEAERLEAFRRVRDGLEEKVVAWVAGRFGDDPAG